MNKDSKKSRQQQRRGPGHDAAHNAAAGPPQLPGALMSAFDPDTTHIVPAVAHHRGKCGPWAISDHDFPLAVDTLINQVREPKFVKRHSELWKTDNGDLVVANSDEPLESQTPFFTFCMKLGGCYNSLRNEEQQNVLRTIAFLRNVCRTYRGRSFQAPAFMLVVALSPESAGEASASSSSSACAQSPFHVFFACHVSLSPLDMCMWHCVVTQLGGVRCENLAMSKSFTATLDYNVNTDDVGGSQMCPKIHTIHEMAYRFRSLDIRKYVPRLVDNYKVESLQTVRIDNLDEGYTVPGQPENTADVDTDDPYLAFLGALRVCEGNQPPSSRSSGRIANDEPRMKRQRVDVDVAGASRMLSKLKSL